MEKPLADIQGMDEISAKQYILGFISTQKLTKKQIEEMDTEINKWKSRIDLAKSKNLDDLVQEAEKEIERLQSKQQQLIAENDELQNQISQMLRQLPTLGAYVRSIDPDLLEQELLIVAGFLPGDEEKAKTDRLFKELEKETNADNALLELKAKMEKNSAPQ
jgi:phage shock protein A